MPVLPALLARAAEALRAVRRAGDRGASALEFAIIAAIVVVAASVIGAVIYNVVDTKSTQLETCANLPVGGECSTGGAG